MLLNTILVFATFFTTIRADTPANCTFEDVQGTWTFYIGENGHDNTLNCNTSWKAVTQLRVHLLFPDIALDDDYNKGFWTMIYNQGFEVVINGTKFFAFSKYVASGSKVTSYCDQTMPGWSHDAQDVSKNWACFYGKKINSIQAPKVSNMAFLSSSKYDKPYRLNNDFIVAIIEKQNHWFPTVYREYEKLTLREMMYKAGGPKKFQSPPPRPVKKEDLEAADKLPTSFDWRDVNGVNYVSPIRNQLQCGSCYAFSTMGMFEARSRISSNLTTGYILSTQDIVSCSEYSQGCEGGFPYLISKYGIDFGLVEESCYPYEGKDSKCTESSSCARHYGNNDYHYVGGFYGACNEPLMRLELVKNGPFSVSFEVTSDFMHYKSGIYVNPGLKDKFNPFEITNHAVVVVGYGVDEKSGMKYWIVKNSWGTGWGEDGYFRIRRGTDELSIESIGVAVTVAKDF
ncbi:dipeptidyl peptidase 1-like [Dendronephthya gigantea]|uniref:dipeptidyl peptidase 1-like n=1 Tax=Dendronephthya gigantea TaxID=151771 RepID=UPI00106A4BBC|nr:dipeptidyl peptidase 1-like [Dendronephthya gigantea]